MDNSNQSWRFRDIFKNNVISPTSISRDAKNFSGHKATGSDSELSIQDTSRVANLINEVRSSSSTLGLYSEYDQMESEVIIQSALKTFADDATVSDNLRAVPFWIRSDSSSLVEELTEVIKTFDLYNKSWSILYNVAKYGDFYLENVYNSRGYLVGIKDVRRPDLIHHIIEDTQDSGYLVEDDLSMNSGGTTIRSSVGWGLYNEFKYTHFFTNDSPKSNMMVAEIRDKDGTPELLEFTVAHGRSMIEAVRLNYRILRLLEDTILTNKIARSEYFRIINVEVGDASGGASAGIVNKLKKLFDSKPKFDGATGEYSSRKVHKPSADNVINATHGGVNGISVNEIGGEIETQHMADVDYFRNKLFSGLGIPKAFLGFEDTIKGGLSDGGGTLAKLDIRYSRSVARLQRGFSSGVEDLLVTYLVSRGRLSDADNFEVIMNNPSSAEEMARLDELKARFMMVDEVAQSVASISSESVNLSQLYSGLIDYFIDDPKLTDIFDSALAKSILVGNLQVSKVISESRVELVEANESLVETMSVAEDMLTSSSGRAPEKSESMEDGEHDFLDDNPRGGGGFTPFDNGGSGFDDLSDPSDYGFEDEPQDLSDDLELGDLSPNTEEADIESDNDLQSWRSMSTTVILENLLTLGEVVPDDFKSDVFKATESFITTGGKSRDEVYKVVKDLTEYYDNQGMTTEVLESITTSIVSGDGDINSTLESLSSLGGSTDDQD